jgi:coproporphyrinogen III oxidase-like Fe-S oxidoreductase
MFDTLNVDMIFNFPNQTMEILAEDVKALKALDVDQVTYYPLMISNCKQKEIEEECGKGHNLNERQAYDFIVDQLTGQYRSESVWCFSKQAESIDEYIVNHDEYIGVGPGYIGVGPGSWGYINGSMYYNTFSVQDYIKRGESDQSPITACRDFSKRDRMRYKFMLALIAGSLSLSDIKTKVGNHFRLFLGGELLFLLSMGALVVRDNKLVLTRKGRYYWVILMGTMFSAVGDYRDMHAPSDDSILLFRKYVPLSKSRQIYNIRVSSF